ncbi:MAG TPA: hypothetical protein DCP92_01390 [Nitrospiraceae bacterium]|nr:hypothetical protein [Nitrospiraceae bacterium]
MRHPHNPLQSPIRVIRIGLEQVYINTGTARKRYAQRTVAFIHPQDTHEALSKVSPLIQVESLTPPSFTFILHKKRMRHKREITI